MLGSELETRNQQNAPETRQSIQAIRVQNVYEHANQMHPRYKKSSIKPDPTIYTEKK